MSLRVFVVFSLLLFIGLSGVDSAEKSNSTPGDNAKDTNVDYYSDDEVELFCISCTFDSIIRITKVTVTYIGDTLLILLQPIYLVFYTEDDVDNNDAGNGKNISSSSQLLNKTVNDKINLSTSANESTTEYSDLLLEMLPNVLSVFENNEVEIMAPSDVNIPVEHSTVAPSTTSRPTTTTTTPTSTTPTTTTTTTTQSPPTPALKSKLDMEENDTEDKGFFQQAYDAISNFLG